MAKEYNTRDELIMSPQEIEDQREADQREADRKAEEERNK